MHGRRSNLTLYSSVVKEAGGGRDYGAEKKFEIDGITYLIKILIA